MPSGGSLLIIIAYGFAEFLALSASLDMSPPIKKRKW
jgi:hypothetical protein